MAKRPLDWQMGVEDEILKELRQILQKAARDIEKEISDTPEPANIGDKLQRAQAEAIAKAAKSHLAGDWSSIGSVLSEARKQAARASVASFYDQIGEPLGKLLGKDGLESLVSAESVRAANTINTVMARLSDSRRSLSQQVWSTKAMTNRWLDSKINQALARGWDAKRLAKEVVGFVNPNTPGGASYAAMRLARTEINNAFHSQTIQQMQNSGVVEYVKWNLSRSHPDKDICDDLAEHRLGDPIPGLDPVEPDDGDQAEANQHPDRPIDLDRRDPTWRDYGMDPDKFSKFDDEMRQEFLDAANNGVHVQTTAEGLQGIFDDGRLKTAFEVASGPGGGAGSSRSYMKDRKNTETGMGIPGSTPPGQRPVCGHGWLPGSDAYRENDMSYYGDISLGLNESVKDRTTWTWGDSMSGGNPRPLWTSELGGATRDELLAAGAASEVALSGSTLGRPDYIEAQVFGGVSLGDVESIYIPSAKKSAYAHLIEIADSLGIGVVFL